MSQDLLYEFGRILFVMAAIGLFAWLAIRLRAPRPLRPRTTCRRCGYDVRETPDRCPECGAGVPDELRLRIALLNDDPPRFLLDDAHALPLREPEPGEHFRRLVILPERQQYDRLLNLLARAGIAAEGEVQLTPMHTPAVRVLRTQQPFPPRFEVAVPAADFAVGAALADFVRREGTGEEKRGPKRHDHTAALR